MSIPNLNSNLNPTDSSTWNYLYSGFKSRVQGTFSYGANTINACAGPGVKWIGQVVPKAFGSADNQNVASVISAIAYAAITLKGAEMLLTPFTISWWVYEDKFQSVTKKTKEKVNLSEFVREIPTPPEISTLTNLADQNQINSKKLLEDILFKADEKEKEATKALNQLENLENLINQAKNEINYEKINIQLLENALKNEKNQTNYENKNKNLTEKLKKLEILNEKNKQLELQAKELQEKAKTLQKDAEIERGKAELLIKSNESAAKLLTDLKQKKPAQTTATETKKNDNNDTKVENYFLRRKEEKTKPKKGEWRFTFPLSKDDVVIKHEEVGKACLRSLAGLPIFGFGALGFIGSAFTPTAIEENLVEALGPSLGQAITTSVSIAATPIQFIVDSIGKHGIPLLNTKLGYLAAAAGLTYGACKLVKKTSFVWFKLQNPPFQRFQGGTFVKDLLDLSVAVTMTAGAVLTLDQVLSGKV